LLLALPTLLIHVFPGGGTGGSRSADAEASMLQELFEDATAADALAKQLQEQLKKAQLDVEELTGKVCDA
jgi:hypothetical protein